MTNEFEKTTPYALLTGDRITVNGETLGCLAPCTVIGVTGTNTLVLQVSAGPKLNDGELVAEEDPRFEEIQRQQYRPHFGFSLMCLGM